MNNALSPLALVQRCAPGLNDPRSLSRILLGIGAGLLPGWLLEGTATMGFCGYELLRMASGQSAPEVVEALMEFGAGLLIAALLGGPF